MKHLRFLLCTPVVLLFMVRPNAQNMMQLLTAEEFHRMKPGPEKIEKVRALERNGWYQQDYFIDLDGKPIETQKTDLAPAVDDMGETVFLVTDLAPEFPGGPAALEDYLQNAVGDLLIKPGESVQNSIRIKFTVEKDGRITNIETEKRLPEWISAETVQRCKSVVEEMPAWSPGVFKDKPVKVRMVMDFSLRE